MSRNDSSNSFAESDELSIEQALILDEVCNTFEARWRSDGKPDILAAAQELPMSLRTVAIKELVQLDVYYRRQNGQSPAVSDYAEPFPELDMHWLARVVGGGSVIDPTTRTGTWQELRGAEFSPTFLGERFAGFELIGEIARGAMGVVFRARQSAPDRVVALKVIRSGEFADPAEVRRFRQEAESAATLDHPNIVSIFEVGECRGVQFYAMRLVEGGSLAVRMANWTVAKATTRAEARQRQQKVAELMASAARAVNHAHQRFILHRDLKPGNILLDEAGTPHVTDFGLARRIGKDSTLTRTGAILGTPSYMAPEQARGREDVTTGADVYGLGAVLYELLAGRPPFVGEDVLDTLYQVRERDPIGPRTVCGWVDRDLETICLKCLEKDPNKRYASAAALADDLERWQLGEPILARRAGVLERAVKWTRRNPAGAGLVALGGVAAAAIIWGLVALSYNAELVEGKQEVEQANNRLSGVNAALTETNGRLDAALARVTQEKGEAERLRGVAEQLRGVAEQLREKAEGSARAARSLLYVNTLQRAEAAAREGRRELALRYLNELRPERFGGHDFRGPDWHFVQRLTANQLALDTNASEAADLRVSADGSVIVGVVAEKEPGKEEEKLTSKLFDATTGKVLRSLDLDRSARGGIPGSGGSFLYGSGNDLRYFQSDTSAPLDHSAPGRVAELALSPDETFATAYCDDGTGYYIVLWRIGRSKPLWKRPLALGVSERRVAGFFGGGRYVLGSSRLWEVATGMPAGDLPFGSVECAADHPTAKWIAYATTGGRIEVRTLPDLKLVRAWDNMPAASLAAADKNALVVGGKDGIVRVLDVVTGKQSPGQLSFPGSVISVGYRAKGGTVVATDGKQVRELRLQQGDLIAIKEAVKSINPTPSFAFRTNSEVVVPYYREGIKGWDARDGMPTRTYPFAHLSSDSLDAASSGDGRWLALGSCATTGVRLWDDQLGKELPSLQIKVRNQQVACSHGVTISPNSRYLAFRSNNAVVIYDLAVGAVAWVVPHPVLEPDKTAAWAQALTFSTNSGAVLVVWHGTKNWTPITKIDVLSGRQEVLLRVPNTPQDMLGYKGIQSFRDGRFLTNGARGEIRLWNHDNQELRSFVGHRGAVNGAAISPDEQRLVTTGDDGTVRLWDIETGLELFQLGKHTGRGMGVAFSPDGTRIASTGADGTLRVWSAIPLELAPPPRPVVR